MSSTAVSSSTSITFSAARSIRGSKVCIAISDYEENGLQTPEPDEPLHWVQWALDQTHGVSSSSSSNPGRSCCTEILEQKHDTKMCFDSTDLMPLSFYNHWFLPEFEIELFQDILGFCHCDMKKLGIRRWVGGVCVLIQPPFFWKEIKLFSSLFAEAQLTVLSRYYIVSHKSYLKSMRCLDRFCNYVLNMVTSSLSVRSTVN